MQGTPQPTVESIIGQNNADIEAAQDRLVRGGSWKKQRIAVVIPAGDMVPLRAAISWWALCFPANQQWVRVPVQGMEVGDAYSHAIDNIILKDPEISKWEYILTIEHDAIVAPNTVFKLLQAMEDHPEYAAVSTAYFTKGPMGVLQAWGNPNEALNFRPLAPVPNTVMECCGIGMGCAMFRMEMFRDERLKRPLFKTSERGTQDLAFWTEARKYGYRCAVDTGNPTGHLDYSGDFGEKNRVY